MMQRRDFVKMTSAGLLTGLALDLKTFAGRTPGFTPIRRNVGTFEGEGGTTGWLITDEALVVIDAQQPPSDAVCIDGIKERSDRRIDFLINTHHHGDHTDGNAVFAPHTDHIVAHRNVPMWQSIRAKERNLTGNRVADITFDHALSLDLGDEKVHLTYHGPAHTSGDAIIHFEKANVVHMGDLVFNRSPAFIDRRAGAMIKSWMDVLQTAGDRFSDETVFIFGHGHRITGNRGDVRYMRDFLGGLLTYAEKGIKAGKSKEEIAETKRLPAFPDNYSPDWQDGISHGLEMAYEELTEN